MYILIYKVLGMGKKEKNLLKSFTSVAFFLPKFICIYT